MSWGRDPVIVRKSHVHALRYSWPRILQLTGPALIGALVAVLSWPCSHDCALMITRFILGAGHRIAGVLRHDHPDFSAVPGSSPILSASPHASGRFSSTGAAPVPASVALDAQFLTAADIRAYSSH